VVSLYAPGPLRLLAGCNNKRAKSPPNRFKQLMSSAKLQVRPILLKKISSVIFFNNYPSDYETIRCHRKEKIDKRFFLS